MGTRVASYNFKQVILPITHKIELVIFHRYCIASLVASFTTSTTVSAKVESQQFSIQFLSYKNMCIKSFTEILNF